MSEPKIAICIPSGRTWEAEAAVSLIEAIRETPFDIAIDNQQGSQISYQRNELVKRALEGGHTHVFWWDCDMIIPPTTILELLAHKKSIVGATYMRKVEPYTMIGKFEKGEGRLKPAIRMPGGCMLVETAVYERIGWPYYFEQITRGDDDKEFIRSEDFSFCHKALDHGYKIWMDINLSQRVKHLGAQSLQMRMKEGHPDRV